MYLLYKTILSYTSPYRKSYYAWDCLFTSLSLVIRVLNIRVCPWTWILSQWILRKRLSLSWWSPVQWYLHKMNMEWQKDYYMVFHACLLLMLLLPLVWLVISQDLLLDKGRDKWLKKQLKCRSSKWGPKPLSWLSWPSIIWILFTILAFSFTAILTLELVGFFCPEHSLLHFAFRVSCLAFRSLTGRHFLPWLLYLYLGEFLWCASITSP